MLLKFKKVYLRLCIKAQKSGIISAEGRWSMKRKVYDKMLEWKAKYAGRYALMLDGARRVGKSWLAEEFAKVEYDSYVLIDFSKAKKDVKNLFDDYLDDLDTFFMMLETMMKVRLVKGRSLVVFDEVQRFPRAREAIKHLVKDGRLHYMQTGALIHKKNSVEGKLIHTDKMKTHADTLNHNQ